MNGGEISLMLILVSFCLLDILELQSELFVYQNKPTFQIFQ